MTRTEPFGNLVMRTGPGFGSVGGVGTTATGVGGSGRGRVGAGAGGLTGRVETSISSGASL